MKLLPVILFILIVCYCCFTIGTQASTSDVTDTTDSTTQNVTSTICRPYLRNYNETEMETEENLLLQGGVLTNYKANAAYLPWDKDCEFYFKAFACARAFGSVCRYTCDHYVNSCWMRNGGNFKVNIFWRKDQYKRKLKYFCEQNSVAAGDECVETNNY